MLQAFGEFISIALPRKQADGLLIVDTVTGWQVELYLQGLFQSFLKAKAVGINAIPIFLRQNKGKSDKALKLSREPDTFWEAEHGQKGKIGSSFFWKAFKKHRLKSLFKKASHFIDESVLRL